MSRTSASQISVSALNGGSKIETLLVTLYANSRQEATLFERLILIVSLIDLDNHQYMTR